MHGLEDVLARETSPVRPGHSRPENLARNDQRLARQILDGRAHHLFGLAIRIHIRVIKKVDAGLISGMDQVTGKILINLGAKSDPRAGRYFTYFQAGTA